MSEIKDKLKECKKAPDKELCKKKVKCDYKCRTSFNTTKIKGVNRQRDCLSSCTQQYESNLRVAPSGEARDRYSTARRAAGNVEDDRQKNRNAGRRREKQRQDRDDRSARRNRLRKAAGKDVKVKKGKAKDIIRALSVKNQRQNYNERQQMKRNNKPARGRAGAVDAGACKSCLRKKCDGKGFNLKQTKNCKRDNLDKCPDCQNIPKTIRKKLINNVTSEPIPDYIMRALKPKKSVHTEYGKLRY